MRVRNLCDLWKSGCSTKSCDFYLRIFVSQVPIIWSLPWTSLQLCFHAQRHIFQCSCLFGSKHCVSFTFLSRFACTCSRVGQLHLPTVWWYLKCCFFSCWQGHRGLEQSHHQLNDLRYWRTLIEVRRYAWTYTLRRGWKRAWLKNCNY